MNLLYVDLFCGAGGTSTGVESARINGQPCAKVIACVNHDANAIASHAANHPDTLHFTEDIRKLDLTQLVECVNLMRKRFVNAFVVVWASLECTNHSKAKGGVSRDADSRTLAEHLIRYIEAIDPDFLQIENVEEFMDWGPLIVKVKQDSETGYEYCPLTIKKEGKGKNATVKYQPTMIPDSLRKGQYYNRWVSEVKNFGYTFDYRILNAADYGAYSSRKRFFGIFAKQGLPIVWPEPTHAKKSQHTLFGSLEKWRPVKEVLDFSDEGVSIFERSKPLSEKTLERIYAGLIKFVAGGKEAFQQRCNHPAKDSRTGAKTVRFLSKYFSGHPESKNISVEKPAHTIKCIDNHALVTSDFLAAYYGNGDNVHSVESPSPTVTTKDRLSLVSPFFMNYYTGGGQLSEVGQPCPAVTTVPKQRLIFIDQQFGQSRPAGIDNPLGAITTNPKYALVNCRPWIMNTNFNNVGSSIEEPSQVITANRKWLYLMNPQFQSALIAKMDKRPPYLVATESGQIAIEVYETDTPMTVKIKEFMALYEIVDIKMRMLKIPELKKIMGFPSDYTLVGTQTDQKKFIGNAVEVNMARALCESLAYKFIEERIAI